MVERGSEGSAEVGEGPAQSRHLTGRKRDMSPRALARVCTYRWGKGPGTWESAEGPNGALGCAAAWGVWEIRLLGA